MNLATYTFLLFFLPTALAAFFLARTPVRRQAVLLGAGLLFVAVGHLAAVPAMCALALFTFFWGRVCATSRHKKWLVGAGIATLLAILAAYKYLSFLTGNGPDLLPAGAIAFLRATAPIGLSFATFQYIAYLVDVARGTIPAERRLTAFLCYAFFFPNMTAGPITRYSALAPQLANLPNRDWTRIQQGLLLLLSGLAKKVLVADTLGGYVDTVWSSPGQLAGLGAWFGIGGYGLQLLMDFSGYSDMAMGVALLFGITLPANFHTPYRADSPSDFWRRWHMTLGAWVRDYLYIPLGGSRVGMMRTVLNGVVVMALVGLWHGAAWTFVVWGVYHGLLLGLFRICKTPWERVPRWVRQTITIFLVMLGWSFFRAPSVGAAIQALGGLFQFTPVPQLPATMFVPLGAAAVVAWLLPEPHLVRWSTRTRSALCFAVLLVACLLFMNYRQATFLYYQF